MAAAAALASCYTHTAHPGQVTVTDFADARVLEVTIADFRVPNPDGSGLWLEAQVVEDSGTCSPVEVRFVDDDGDIVGGSFGFESRAGLALVADASGSLEVDPAGLATVLLVEPVRLRHDGASATLHTEHVFNLRQFVEQLSCLDD